MPDFAGDRECEGPGATHHHGCACREARFREQREALENIAGFFQEALDETEGMEKMIPIDRHRAFLCRHRGRMARVDLALTRARGSLPSPRPGTRVCPTCEGTGINPLARYMVCPKCNGERRVPERKW